MYIDNTKDNDMTISVSAKAMAFVQLLKFRLSFLVAFSGGMAYMLGAGSVVNWTHFTLFIVGGFLATGAANTFNQIIEVKYDRLMKRTMDRPLPTGVLDKREALIFALLCLVVGLGILYYYINFSTFLLTALSVVLYAFVYTPLKRVGPIAVLVGAFPGALPPMIGWVAVTNDFCYEAGVLFMIQFIWQFPHFWAIAWVADEDYKKAGFKLLPSKGGKDLNTAFTIMIYTLLLLPLGLLPTYFGLAEIESAIIATVCGVLFLIQTFNLMRTCSRKSAMRLMFGSFFYLPIVQIAYLVYKI